VIVVDTSKMPGIPRHEFQLDAPEQWIATIQNEMKTREASSAQTVQPTYVKEVVREIVKYPCPYCSALIEVTSSQCPFCGAPQKK
jgi:rubrerythrin